MLQTVQTLQPFLPVPLGSTSDGNDEREMDISKPRPVAENSEQRQTFKHSAQFFDARIGVAC